MECVFCRSAVLLCTFALRQSIIPSSGTCYCETSVPYNFEVEYESVKQRVVHSKAARAERENLISHK